MGVWMGREDPVLNTSTSTPPLGHDNTTLIRCSETDVERFPATKCERGWRADKSLLVFFPISEDHDGPSDVQRSTVV